MTYLSDTKKIRKLHQDQFLVLLHNSLRTFFLSGDHPCSRSQEVAQMTVKISQDHFLLTPFIIISVTVEIIDSRTDSDHKKCWSQQQIEPRFLTRFWPKAFSNSWGRFYCPYALIFWPASSPLHGHILDPYDLQKKHPWNVRFHWVIFSTFYDGQ